MKEFNKVNLTKSIDRFNEGSYLHFVDINHPRELLRSPKTRVDKGRDTGKFS